MKRIKRMLIVVTLSSLALGATALSAGCIIDDSTDAEITCNNFDHFLSVCGGTCGASWDCEYYYGDLAYDDQIALDDCSDCMAAGASGGTCHDCTAPGIPSCINFMEDLLGVDCW